MNYYPTCPNCGKRVDVKDRKCDACGEKLSKAKFKFNHVLLYGSLITILAIAIAAILVPLTVLIVIICFFLREKKHVMKFDNEDDDSTTSANKVVDI